MLQMINENFLTNYYQTIVQLSQQNSKQINEFNQKYSKVSLNKFTLQLFNLLDFDDNLAINALFLILEAIKSDLKIHRKCFHRLIIICVILTCKTNLQEQYTFQSYSLMSGMKINELIHLEYTVLQILEFKVIVQQQRIVEAKYKKKSFAMITYTIFLNAKKLVNLSFYFNIYNIKSMKKKQYIDFSFQQIKSQTSIKQQQLKQSQKQQLKNIQIFPKQYKPSSINYRHLTQKKNVQIYKPNRIFDVEINNKINMISQQLDDNIKKRMQLQRKLNLIQKIQKVKAQKDIFQVYNHNTYKDVEQYALVYDSMNKKADKITQFTQKYDNSIQKQHNNSLEKNKKILLNYDEPIKKQQKQKILIPIIETFAKNKKPMQVYTVPNQIKIQEYLRKVTFPEIPKENLQKLKTQVQNLFAVHSPHSDIYYLCMIINFHFKNYSKVRKFFEQIVNFRIFNEKSYWIAAQSQFIMQNYDLCLKLTEQCINKLDQKLLPRFIYLKAKSYQNIGNYINSIICFNQLIKIRPKISEYYLQRGINYHRVGYYKQSKQDFVTFGLLKPQAQQFIKDKVLQQKNQIRKRQLIGLLARMF